MRQVWMIGGSGAGMVAGGVLFEHGWVLGVICLVLSLLVASWRVVHTTRARTALDKAASARQDWLVITLPVLPLEVQKEVVSTLTPPSGDRAREHDGGPARP